MVARSLIPAGDFRTSYAADTTIFPTKTSRNFAILGVVLLLFAPKLFSEYWLAVSIQIGIFAIAALGLNILVGFTGQISIGHAAFFLLGAFTSAYITTLMRSRSSSRSRSPASSQRLSASSSACLRRG